MQQIDWKKFSPIERFWMQVSKSDGCWFWIGSKIGYPPFQYGTIRVNGQIVRAHRFAYELLVGPIPTGAEVCHHCDNPACVRPDHLFTGSRSDNMQDKVRKDRHNPTRGERNNKAKLREADIVTIRSLYASGGITQEEIATSYGVQRTLISQIIRGTIWKHVDGPRSYKRSSAGFRGVSFNQYGTPCAYIKHKGKSVYLGHFNSPEGAARAYDIKAKELHGLKARLNFPTENAA